jgi:hypothetical protein
VVPAAQQGMVGAVFIVIGQIDILRHFQSDYPVVVSILPPAPGAALTSQGEPVVDDFHPVPFAQTETSSRPRFSSGLTAV